MKRSTLPISKLRAFTQWATQRGYTIEAPRASEVLRLRKEPAPALRFLRALDRVQATGAASDLVEEWRADRERRKSA